MLRFLHDHVADMRKEESRNILFLAILDNAVPAGRIDARHKNRIEPIQTVTDLVKTISVIPKLLRDAVKTLRRLALNRTEPPLIQFIAVDKDRFPCRINPEEILVPKP